MKQIFGELKKTIGDATINLGEKSCEKSTFLFVHEVPIPEKMKQELEQKKRK